MMLPLALAALISVAGAPDCSAQETQTAMNQCATTTANDADARLNRSYAAASAAMRAKGMSLAGLTSAETAWIDMRDKTCAFERGLYTNGTMAPYVAGMCVARLSNQRADRLDRYSDAVNGNYVQQRRAVDTSVDRRLNATYATLRKNTPAWALAQLAEAELAWIKYRDRTCSVEGGGCVTELERERADELKGASPESAS